MSLFYSSFRFVDLQSSHRQSLNTRPLALSPSNHALWLAHQLARPLAPSARSLIYSPTHPLRPVRHYRARHLNSDDSEAAHQGGRSYVSLLPYLPSPPLPPSVTLWPTSGPAGPGGPTTDIRRDIPGDIHGDWRGDPRPPAPSWRRPRCRSRRDPWHHPSRRAGCAGLPPAARAVGLAGGCEGRFVRIADRVLLWLWVGMGVGVGGRGWSVGVAWGCARAGGCGGRAGRRVAAQLVCVLCVCVITLVRSVYVCVPARVHACSCMLPRLQVCVRAHSLVCSAMSQCLCECACVRVCAHARARSCMLCASRCMLLARFVRALVRALRVETDGLVDPHAGGRPLGRRRPLLLRSRSVTTGDRQ
jgi:hypothetical protein